MYLTLQSAHFLSLSVKKQKCSLTLFHLQVAYSFLNILLFSSLSPCMLPKIFLFLKSYSCWPLSSQTLPSHPSVENGLRFPSVFAAGNLWQPLQWKQADQLIWPGNNIHPNLPGRAIILQAGGEKTVILTLTGLLICVYQRVVVVCEVSGNSEACLMKIAVWFWLEISLFCSVKAELTNVLLGVHILRTVCTILNNY